MMTGKELTRKQLEAIEHIKENPLNLKLYGAEEQFYELCLEAVKRDARALCLVEEQTFEICVEAIKQIPWTLKYVKEQTPEICLEAVREDGSSLKYVQNKTPEICLEAVKEDESAIRWINDEMLTLDFKMKLYEVNPNVIEYLEI